MWMPIMVFFAMTFEHSVVNMFLFPSGILMGAHFNWADYFLWNEIPTIVGNIVGGLAFTGLTLYSTHMKTAPKRDAEARGLTVAFDREPRPARGRGSLYSCVLCPATSKSR